MRRKIWKMALSKHPEGSILSLRLLTIRAVLFPVDFAYWRLSDAKGYSWRTNTWNIHGIKYSDEALRSMAESSGATYKIKRTGNTVTMARVDL